MMPKHQKRASIPAIKTAVSRIFMIERDEIETRNVGREPALVRQVAMYLAYCGGGRSFRQVGRQFSRDHTTVLHAYRKIGAMVEEDAGFAHQVRCCEQTALAAQMARDAALAA